MTSENIEEMRRLAVEAIKGEPLRIPTRRERELGQFVLALLIKIDDAEKMAAAVDVMIKRNVLDPRSTAGSTMDSPLTKRHPCASHFDDQR